MGEMGNESLIAGIIFTLVVVAICTLQGIRACIGRAGHRLQVKSKAVLGV